MGGQKIIDGLKDAVAGNFSRVTIDGQVWVCRDTEIARLRAGLKLIKEAGGIHGGAWCVAQAVGTLDDLDFDAYPETGRETPPRGTGEG